MGKQNRVDGCDGQGSIMKIIYIAVLMFFAVCVGAQECPAVFPDPASSYAENGEIRFNTSAALLNSDGEIAARRMRDNSRGTSCGVGPCLLSGQPSAALPLPPFEASGSASVSYTHLTLPTNREV